MVAAVYVKFGSGLFKVEAGFPKFARLKILKISVRNSRLYLSEKRKRLLKIKSNCLKLGPVSTLRGKSPKAPAKDAANAAGFKKLRSLLRYGLTPATRFGRRVCLDEPPPGALTTAINPAGSAGKLAPKLGRLAV